MNRSLDCCIVLNSSVNKVLTKGLFFFLQFTRRETEVLDSCADYMWVDFCISTCCWVGHCMLTTKEKERQR